MNKNYFKILEINENANLEEIRNAYIKMAKKYHPDKNSDKNANEKFNEVNEAYHYLINNDSYFKKYYNKINFNKEYFNKEYFNKFVNVFFNDFIYKHKYHSNKKLNIKCTLEELYHGCIKNISYNRKFSISPTDFKIIKNTIKLIIKPGFKNNQTITYNELGDCLEFNTRAKDLIIVIKEVDNNIFKRDDKDLIYNLNLSLKEALTCDTILEIPHLNNNIIKYNINKIIEPNSEDIIENLGMPIENIKKNNNENYGNLIIKFNIIFPKQLNEQDKKILRSIHI